MPVDASKVKCKGPGIGKTVTASFPQEFTVDAKQAGTAPLEVDVTGPDRKKRKPDIKDNKDGTFAVTYVPDLEGELLLNGMDFVNYVIGSMGVKWVLP